MGPAPGVDVPPLDLAGTCGEPAMCMHCFAVISTEEDNSVVRMDTRLWHIECFCCTRCHRRVPGEQENVVLIDGMPLCASCTLLCGTCAQPITEEAVMCEQDSYHPECFCCSFCGTVINTNAFARESGILCCTKCNESLERDVTTDHTEQSQSSGHTRSNTPISPGKSGLPASMLPHLSPVEPTVPHYSADTASSALSPATSSAASPNASPRGHTLLPPAHEYNPEENGPTIPHIPPELFERTPRIRHGHSASVSMLDVGSARMGRPRSGSTPSPAPAMRADDPLYAADDHDRNIPDISVLEIGHNRRDTALDEAQPQETSAPLPEPEAEEAGPPVPVPISKRLSELLQLDILNEYGVSPDDEDLPKRQSVSSMASQRSDRELVLQIISAHTGFVSPAALSDESDDRSIAIPIEDGDNDPLEQPLETGVLRSIALSELFAIDKAASEPAGADVSDAIRIRVAAVIDTLTAHMDVLKSRCARDLENTAARHSYLKNGIKQLESEHARISSEISALNGQLRQRYEELAQVEARATQHEVKKNEAPEREFLAPQNPPAVSVTPPSATTNAYPSQKSLDASLPPLPSPRKFNWIRPRLIAGRELASLRPLIKEALLQTPQDAAASITTISPPVPPKPTEALIAEHSFQPVIGQIMRGSAKCLVCQRTIKAPPELRCTLCQQSVHGRCVHGSAACAYGGPPFPPVIFGGFLVDQLNMENTHVPRIVEACIRAVEEQGMDYEGIYRKSGSLQQQRAIVYLFENGTRFNLGDTYFFNDPAAVTGVLKQYLRELREPLIPRVLHERMYAIADQNGVPALPNLVSGLREIISEVPISHRPTLARVVQHLNAVMRLEPANKMNSRSLGLVFGREYTANKPLSCVAKKRQRNSCKLARRPKLSAVRYLLTRFD